MARYGDAAQLLATFSPDLQYRLAAVPERCFAGAAPTLAAVRAQYGAAVAVSWLEIQIRDLATFAGVRDKLTQAQSLAAANTILAAHYYLNLAELMMFFFHFKSGRYGRFYGSIDPLVITTALQEFCRERRDALFHIESERAAAERLKPRPDVITREEYERLKARAAAGDPEAAERLKPPTR